jgi:hypothetical protein
MKPSIIVIDGKTYKSVEEMPDDVRRQYEQAMSSLKDQNGNRIPDVLEANMNILADNNKDGVPDIIENTPGGSLVANTIKVLVDGREFNSLDELPPDVRAKYDKAMGTIDANRNGIPEFMEGMMRTQQTTTSVSTNFGTDTTHHAPRQPMPVTPAIEPDRSNGWMLALLGVLLLFLCAAAGIGIWYFFLR